MHAELHLELRFLASGAYVARCLCVRAWTHLGAAFRGCLGKHKENTHPAENSPQLQLTSNNPLPQESGVTHYKGLSKVPFLQSALPRSCGCLLLLPPLKLIYLQSTMEQLVNLIIEILEY